VFLIPAAGGVEQKLRTVWNGIKEGRPLKGAGGRLEYVRGPRVSWHPGGRWLVVPDKNAAGAPLALFLVSAETGQKRRLGSYTEYRSHLLSADTEKPKATSPSTVAIVSIPRVT